jgi:beta-glucosidase
MTWGKALADYPATSPAHPERSAKGVEGKTTFSEGLLVGYRWFDDQHIQPLFPFGFGLSYTSFAVSGLQVAAKPDGGARVTFRVKNTGGVTGDAVPQIYLDAPESKPEGVQFAPRTLVAFDRVSLQPGEEREVTLEVAQRAFEYWSVQQKAWIRAAGSRTLRAGQSSRDLPLTATMR